MPTMISEHEQAALQTHDFVARPCLHGLEVFHLRPVQVLQPDLHDARQG